MRHELLGGRLDRAPRLRRRLLANSLAAPEQSSFTSAPPQHSVGRSRGRPRRTPGHGKIPDDQPFGYGAGCMVGTQARIPLRPANMRRAHWLALVLEWLREDMALSAWIWSQLAAFMRAEGYYVLRASISHPKETRRTATSRPDPVCGRDAHYWAPPTQIRACTIRALGSHLGC